MVACSHLISVWREERPAIKEHQGTARAGRRGRARRRDATTAGRHQVADARHVRTADARAPERNPVRVLLHGPGETWACATHLGSVGAVWLCECLIDCCEARAGTHVEGSHYDGCHTFLQPLTERSSLDKGQPAKDASTPTMSGMSCSNSRRRRGAREATCRPSPARWASIRRSSSTSPGRSSRCVTCLTMSSGLGNNKVCQAPQFLRDYTPCRRGHGTPQLKRIPPQLHSELQGVRAIRLAQSSVLYIHLCRAGRLRGWSLPSPWR